jgi:pimeloyl-ACP methyl ester carboxylesterase
MATAAGPEPHWLGYHLLRVVARWLGPAAVAGRVMPILFGRTFLADPARAELRQAWRQRLMSNDRIGTARAAGGVIGRRSFEEHLANIALPTLVLVGAEDTATPPEKARFLHEHIAGSCLRILPAGGHSLSIEEPETVNEALRSFFQSLPDRPS